MSQRSVERTLGKLITDETFRTRFFREPAGTCITAGLDLLPEEMEALCRIPVDELARLCRLIDDRICRLHLHGEGEPA